MLSLILIPLIIIIVLIGLVMMIAGFVAKRKWLLWIGGAIVGVPFVLIAMGFLLVSQNHREYIGTYTGKTDNGKMVTLKLDGRKDFLMKMEDCNKVVTGTWDNVLMDEYILELYISGNKYGIQASLTKSDIVFYNPLDLACMTKEKLELKKVSTSEHN